MTQVLTGQSLEPGSAEASPVSASRSPGRPWWLPLPFAFAGALAGASWAMGGQPWLTDLAFTVITLAAAAFFLEELVRFPRRFGAGGVVLFGGVLIWFCHDYLVNWLGGSFRGGLSDFDAATIAKAAACHGLFIGIAALGLLIRPPRWLANALRVLPEPAMPSFYLVLVLGTLAVGLSPYFLFTEGPWYVSIFRELTGGRVSGAQWTVGRSASINYNWGAYLAVLISVGSLGGVLAVFYAVLIARSFAGRCVGWLVWMFWVAQAFGTGTRGQVAFMMLPAVALVFLKLQAMSDGSMRALARAYVVTGLFAAVTFTVVQFMGFFRATGYLEADLNHFEVTQVQGNSMFSSGLVGFSLIPGKVGYYYDGYPGQKLLAPLPVIAWQFIYGPIPRVLWNDKPYDRFGEWYNDVYTGHTQDLEAQSTTVSQGLVGWWYFRFGLSGIIQGGLLFGFLIRLFETFLQGSEGRPMRLILSLSIGVWLFRCFRSFGFAPLHEILVCFVFVVAAVWLFNSLLGRRPATV
jgi:hypothetical protein